MDDKRRDSSSSSTLPAPPPSEPPHSSDSASTRRRAGALKRKASAALGSSNHGNTSSPSFSSSAPSKRASRDKALSATPHSQIHNGPLTRARQGGPAGERLSAAEVAAAVAVKAEERRKAEAEEARKAAEALDAAIEAEFKRISSRSDNVHVVPNHCGWFAWTKVHSLEEHSLPSFFNGKSENRTPEVYLEIRNLIVQKFHANPNLHIELKDLSELEVGDSDARQEVLEFLDYWGLINFHPFAADEPTGAENDSKGAEKKDFLVEKLYRFDKIHLPPAIAPRNSLCTQPISSGLFSEALIADELSKLEGPSVDYHCNSCSADCSWKRYHCQKQADFDLCTDCFNGGKFGSNMSSSDFILMEPADVHGAIGGKWTDQETLLLLEALELFKENWSEIAEHVATKTKAQCMSYFLQMPIQDPFLDGGNEMYVNKETGDVTSTYNDALATSNVPESVVNKTDNNQGETDKSPMETSKLEDPVEKNADAQAPVPEATEPKDVQENLKPENSTVDEVKEKDENVIDKALREAFEAIGCSSIPGACPSFSEVGNPVMALVGFLARLVGSDVASALLRGSLKSIGGNTPGIELAMKHCFVLEDPPDQQNLNFSHSAISEVVKLPDNDLDRRDEKQKMDVHNSNEDGKDLSNCENGEDNATPALEEKGEGTKMSESGTKEGKIINDTSSLDVSKDSESNSLKQSNGLGSGALKEDANGETSTASKDVDMVADPSLVETKDSLPLEPKSGGEISCEDAKDNGNAMECDLPATVNKNEEPIVLNELELAEKSVAKESALLPDEPKNIPDSITTEKSELQLAHTLVENGTTGNNQTKVVEGKSDSLAANSNCGIDKLKRAAASALIAAAVKAKLLADEEEDRIRQLTVFLIDKQLHKLEAKLAFFNDLDQVTSRVREQFDRSRHRLYQERAQIIASRLGVPASSGARGMPPALSANRITMNFSNLGPRAATAVPFLRPPISRTMSNVSPNPPNSFVSTSTAGR